MRIGKILKERRLEIGISQDEVSRKTGYSRSFVANIEAGRRYPCPFSLSVFLDVLSIDNRQELMLSLFAEKVKAC